MNRLLHAFRSSVLDSYGLHWFFTLILIGIVVFIIIFANDTEAILFKRSQMPLMEIYDFDMYKIEDSQVNGRVQGKKAIRYVEYEIGYEMILSMLDRQRATKQSQKKPYIEPVQYIYGQEVRRVNDVYFFDKGGVFAKTSGEVLYATRAIYDAPRGMLRGDGGFWSSAVEGNSVGESFIYDLNNQTLEAKQMKMHIMLDALRSTK